MFDEQLSQRFAGLQAELNRALYRHYTLLRELEQLDENLLRMEAGIAEVERIQKEWETQKAIDEAAATEGE